MSRVRTEFRDELVSTGIVDRLTGGGIYLAVDDSVTDYLRRTASAGESG